MPACLSRTVDGWGAFTAESEAFKHHSSGCVAADARAAAAWPKTGAAQLHCTGLATTHTVLATTCTATPPSSSGTSISCAACCHQCACGATAPCKGAPCDRRNCATG
jgi:hypothetical protein